MIKLLKFALSLRITKNGSNLLPKQNIYYSKTFYSHESFKKMPGKLINPRVEAALRNGDRIPPNFELIYRSKLIKYIYYFYPLSIISYVLAASAYCYFKFNLRDISYPIIKKEEKNVSPIGYRNATEVDITFIFYLLMNTATLYFLRRTPIRIWLDNSKGEYRMILIGNLPPFRRQIAFEAGQLTRKYMWPENALQEAIHRYRRRYYNITSVYFRSPVDYYRMVGYNSKLKD